MDVGIVENTRQYIFDPQNNQSPHEIESLAPDVRKRKNIDNLEEKGHYREIEGVIGPLQNIMTSSTTDLSKIPKSHRKLYLFLDVNFKTTTENASKKAYEEGFNQLVQDRIERAKWNGSDTDYDIILLTLDEDADASSDQWKSILRKLPALKTGSRLFIFDNREEIKDVNNIEDLLLSNHIKLRELNSRIAIKDGPLEILGLFSNSFQRAISNPEMFRELKEEFDEKTEVIILPTSMMPMDSKLHFERAGIVEALVASHKIGGEYAEWIDSSQEKVFTRLDTEEQLFDERHTAICTSTFVSKIFSTPHRDAPRVHLDSEPIRNDGLKCEISEINSIIETEGHERLNHNCCGNIQGAIAELVHRSMTYINSFFQQESNKQFRPILFASVILMNENIRKGLRPRRTDGNDQEDEAAYQSRISKLETRIKKMWRHLCSLEKPQICGSQTMTAKRKERQTKEGSILEGWKNTCQKWCFKTGKNGPKEIKLVLTMILEDGVNIEEAIVDWKNFLEEFKEREMRTTNYAYGMRGIQSPKYGLILLSQKVCTQLQILFSETKKVTHGDLYLLADVPGMDEEFQRLYIDKLDQRYIPASKAYEIIKKLNDALTDCNWLAKPAEHISVDPSTKDLKWWSD